MANSTTSGPKRQDTLLTFKISTLIEHATVVLRILTPILLIFPDYDNFPAEGGLLAPYARALPIDRIGATGILAAARRVDTQRAAHASEPRGTMSRKLAALTASVVSIVLLSAATAIAAPSLTLSTGPDPAESITTQIIASGTTTNGETVLSATYKASGGQGCGSNYSADGGETIFSDRRVEEVSFTHSENHEFARAGSYLLCAWLNDESQLGDPVVATASLTVVVRPPHLTLAISAPPVVSTGQTFQITTTAQAEVSRTVNEYTIPNTGRGCPANAGATVDASGASSVYFAAHGTFWDLDGGPFTEVANQIFNSAGQYLVCAYIEYPSTESSPEITANATITAVAPPPPCVVPSFTTATRLATIEQAIRAGSCAVGTVRSIASRTVRAGYVISLSRPSAQHEPNGTPVNITVSTGPPCIVPRVSAGTVLGTVERRLAANHCAVGKVSSARSRRVRRGRVLRLGARTGQVLASHAPIAIVIARHRR